MAVQDKAGNSASLRGVEATGLRARGIRAESDKMYCWLAMRSECNGRMTTNLPGRGVWKTLVVCRNVYELK